MTREERHTQPVNGNKLIRFMHLQKW